MVTRTIVTTIYNCMVVDAKTKKVENLDVYIPSADTMNAKSLDKAIRLELPDGKLYVQAVDSRQVETLLGMTEQEFIRLAKVLPPR